MSGHDHEDSPAEEVAAPMAPKPKPANGDDHIAAQAIRLALDIATRGQKALNDFIAQERADIDRAIKLSGEGWTSSTSAIAGGTAAEKASREDALHDAEQAFIDFINAVAPPASLVVARVLTQNPGLRDRGWRQNTVTALRKVASIGTSLINDSVALDETPVADAPHDVIERRVEAGDEGVTIELVTEQVSEGRQTIAIQVTPLVGDGTYMLVTPDPIELWSDVADAVPIELHFAKPLVAGTQYSTSLYALCEERVVASAELRLSTIQPA